MEVLTECADERNEVGPNGGRIEVMENGDRVDRVEWVELPHMWLRGQETIAELYDDLWNIVSLAGLGPEDTEDEVEFAKHWERQAQRIQKKWELGRMAWDEVDWGFEGGRLATLAWVLGSDWRKSPTPSSRGEGAKDRHGSTL